MEKEVFGTTEWASSTINFISGCSHDCKYCYAKEMAIRCKRKQIDTWKNEELTGKEKKVYKKQGTIMFPSTHDITPEHLGKTLEILQTILEPGNDILIVTKPHLECIRAICKKFRNYKEKILFRFTIGSTDEETLKFWEPGAPSFRERKQALQDAFYKGFKTSVSCEPMLDKHIERVVKKLEKFVTDSIWIGKMNKATGRVKINGGDEETMERLRKQIEWQSDDSNIMKIYNTFKNHPKIKWKESIKKIVGIEVPTEIGLDV